MLVQKLFRLIPMMQTSGPEYWIAMFFVTGLVFGICSALVVGFLWHRARKSVMKQAEEAGTSLGIDIEPSIDLRAIQGCGYCIGFIVVAVAVVLGISMATLIPEGSENLIVTVAITVFAAMLWGLMIWSVPYYMSEKRRFQHLLDKALAEAARNKG
ncbi:MAG: hypothetical protein ACFFAY_07405 [Promethearchaeota archaeon]